MTKLYILLLIVGIGATQYQLWAGPGSWWRLHELEAGLKAQEAKNDALRQQNEALAAELYSLSHNQDAIEARARRDLNMVKPNELLFRFETPEEERRETEPAEPIETITPEVEPGSEPTFDAKKADLYHAPKNLRAPKAKDYRE